MSRESIVICSVAYRRALPRDFPAIVKLNSDNFIANLSAEDRRDGFLSAQFTLEQTAAIAADLGTTVAIVYGHVAGFLCAMRNEFDHGSPVVAKMIESYDRMRFEGKLLVIVASRDSRDGHPLISHGHGQRLNLSAGALLDAAPDRLLQFT